MPATWNDLTAIVNQIVDDSVALKDKYTDAKNAHLSYCAIFCQSPDEFSQLKECVSENGKLVDDTATGPVYLVNPVISTKAGDCQLVKIRRPDENRPERGDTDFALESYEDFKQRYLGQENFKLIEREEFEMIELMDSHFNVRVYFSNPPVEEHSGIREALADKSYN